MAYFSYLLTYIFNNQIILQYNLFYYLKSKNTTNTKYLYYYLDLLF